MAAVALLVEGPQKAQDVAKWLYDSDQNGWHLLNNISQPLNLVNAGGWWYVQLTPFADVGHLLHGVRERLEETREGDAYCRPMNRRDMVRLENVLAHILKIGTPPEPES
jgi:hypothetical protein